MSEININQTDLNITVTPNTSTLSVFTGGYACAQGNTTEVQFNNGGVLGGANGLTYDSGSQTTTAANLTVTNETDLGAIGNITITGGNSGEVLTTDGSGGLSFSEIANANFAAFAGNIIEPAQPNITSVGNLSNLDVTGNVAANYFIGNGSQLTGLAEGDEISNGTSNVRVLSANGDVAIGVNGNANVFVATATGIQVPAANLGAVGNLVITGGNNGFVLQTDGTGNLTWTQMTGNAGNGVVGGSNTQVQYNDGGVFGGSAGFTFDKASNLLSAPGGITAVGNVQGAFIKGDGGLLSNIVATATSISNGTSNVVVDANGNIRISFAGTSNVLVVGSDVDISNANLVVSNANIVASGNGRFVGNAAGLTNIPAANLTGTVPTANTVSNNAQPNITSLGTLTGLGVNGNITAANITANTGRFTGNGSGLSAIAGGNVTGQVGNALVAGTVYTAAQPNITSVGTLTSLSVTGNVSAGNVSATDISGTTLGGTLTTAAQPNITSVGTLTSLAVTGNVTAGNIDGGNLISANFVTGTLTTNAQPNVTSLGTLTGLTVDGANIDLANGVYNGNGSGLSAITGANVTGTVANATHASTANTVTTNAQPNITSVGTLANLNVTGPIYANTSTIVANRFQSLVTGLAPFSVSSSILVTQLNADLLDGYNADTGSIANTVVARDANADITANNITAVSNISGNYILGNGSFLTGIVTTGNTIVGGNSNVTVDANSNVRISVTGVSNIVDIGVATVTFTKNVEIYSNLLVANANIVHSGTGRFEGNGSGLTNIAGANVTGTVANATHACTANTVTNAAQSNITSLGTLTGLNVNGNIVAANITANTGVFVGNANGLTNIPGSNVTGIVANANYAANAGNANVSTFAGTVTTAAQPNITSVGTLTSLDISGNLSTGNANLGNLVIANYFSGDGSLLSNVSNITSFANGNSNVRIASNSNVTISVAGNSNVTTFTGSGLFTNVANVTTLQLNNDQISLGKVTALTGTYTIGIGTNATMIANGIALGYEAGRSAFGSRDSAILIGLGAGSANANIGNSTIIIGKNAANLNGIAKDRSIIIGDNAGYSASIGANAISIGHNSGRSNIGNNSIAIGANAGQGGNATANNTIVINATGANLEGTTANALYIKPVRTVNSIAGLNALYYDSSTGEIVVYVP